MIIGTIREEISDPVIHLTKISNDAIIKESLDVKIDYSIQLSFRVRAGNNVPGIGPLYLLTDGRNILKTNIREEDESVRGAVSRPRQRKGLHKISLDPYDTSSTLEEEAGN